MKLSKEDLKKKIADVVEDEDTQISLLEDIEDSFVEPNESDKVDKTDYDELETKYKDLQEKYKQRFLAGDDQKDVEDKKEDVDEELEEKEVIDIKEI